MFSRRFTFWLMLSLTERNQIREPGDHERAPLQVCEGWHFRCVDDSFLSNPNWLLATAATWGSTQGHGKGGQEVAVKVYAPCKVLKQSVGGCRVWSFKVKCTPGLVCQKSGRYNRREGV